MQGLENMLVVTRSIVSSPQHLDVKVRIAQGLSREGWSITKNLFSEITVSPGLQYTCMYTVCKTGF